VGFGGSAMHTEAVHSGYNMLHSLGWLWSLLLLSVVEFLSCGLLRLPWLPL
jgi:hypothetical protein